MNKQITLAEVAREFSEAANLAKCIRKPAYPEMDRFEAKGNSMPRRKKVIGYMQPKPEIKKEGTMICQSIGCMASVVPIETKDSLNCPRCKFEHPKE